MQRTPMLVPVSGMTAALLVTALTQPAGATTSVETTFTGVTRDYTCSVTVPPVVDFGTISKGTTKDYAALTITVACNGQVNTTLSADYERGEPDFKQPDWLYMGQSDLSPRLMLRKADGHALNYVSGREFCEGINSRECQLNPRVSAEEAYVGLGKATAAIRFTIRYS